MAELHLGGLDAEPRGEEPLEADRHVAQPDGTVAVVEQRAGDDADGVREVDDPRIVARTSPDLVSDLEHDRHRAQRLGEPSGSCRLLADAAAPQGHRLVELAGRLSAHPQLDEDEVGSVERTGQIVGDRQTSWPPMTGEDPGADPGDRFQPFAVGVVEDQLAHRCEVTQPADAVDQLRRVAAPATDDRHLHRTALSGYRAPLPMSRDITSRPGRIRTCDRRTRSRCSVRLSYGGGGVSLGRGPARRPRPPRIGRRPLRDGCR